MDVAIASLEHCSSNEKDPYREPSQKARNIACAGVKMMFCELRIL
jgi:predicted peroxiredoxin